jgi:hypothetical protein
MRGNITHLCGQTRRDSGEFEEIYRDGEIVEAEDYDR